ncbi:hypothetical protein B7494_g5871 [Chlorociboria aeruginascens]|nr:hypothetical protein B7494_g5871 [Chlorociboria aeruginascens]
MKNQASSRVIIIGAGWTGLAAAKSYLAIKPNVSLTIIDDDSSVGGVWSASRIYPGLIADSTAAIFDYSDFPMDVVMGLDKWADLPAATVHEYLERYVDEFDLRRRCRLNTKVVRVERNEKRGDAVWKLEIQNVAFHDRTRETLFCDKLIVASGISSSPSLPSHIDWGTFDGQVMHSKEVGMKHTILTSNSVRRLTVVGGNKSAVDVVNMCALAGKEVDWIIRKEGHGPGILMNARTNGVHAGALKAARISQFVSPSVLSPKGFVYWFLHSGKCWPGTYLLKWMFARVSKSLIKDMYEGNENKMKISPEIKNSASVLHDGSTFMNMVAEGKLIHVHRTSVSYLAGQSVHLSDGQIVPCDAAVFATGWEINQPKIFHPSLLPELGLPYLISEQSTDLAKHWNTLDELSEIYVKETLPILASPPPEVAQHDKEHMRQPTLTPYHLYRNMISPNLAARGDRSLLILGLLINTCVPTYAEVSSLWGISYLENLPFVPAASRTLSNIAAMEKEISLFRAWDVLRFRDRASLYPDGSLEIQDYTDILMRDLGLRPDRKRLSAEKYGSRGLFGWRGWYREWFEPYRGLDYAGLIAEYLGTWDKQI